MVLVNADSFVNTRRLTWPEASYCSSFLVVSAIASLWAGSQFFSFFSLINLSCNFFGNKSKMGFTPTWYKPLGLFQVSGIYKKYHGYNSHQHHSLNNCQNIIFYMYYTWNTLYLFSMPQIFIFHLHLMMPLIVYIENTVPWVYVL